MELIQNRPFDELVVGEQASLTHPLSARDIELFAAMSGDVNPMCVDEAFAKDERFHKVVAHGMWGGSLISTVLGTLLPGPGTVYLGQSLRFHAPVAIGDVLTVSVNVAQKENATRIVKLDCQATNQFGAQVISGTAEVIAPTEKIVRQKVALPEISVLQKGRFHQQFIAKARQCVPLPTAVVHPVDAVSLKGALAAAREGLIVPVLVGPQQKIHAAAEQAQLDISSFELIDVEHSEAAAVQAVAMAKAGAVGLVMKGALHTDELMHAVVDRERGLRTGRRVSHVFVVDVPRYPRPLLITDAAINVHPGLEDKRDIAQNAIDLAHALGISAPKLAILSAVETITAAIPSTLDAAALCKMADRGQITGAIVDGPLAFDNAVSSAAALTKGITSPVAGLADILLVPDIEAGNMLAKQLEYLADSIAAGIVLGTRVPVVLTSRADGESARLASCAVAVLAHYAQSH